MSVIMDENSWRESITKHPIVQHPARFLIHFLIGWGVFICWRVHWSLAMIFAWWFTWYELNEDFHKKDEAFVDIAGAIGGLVLCCIIYLGRA